MFQATSCSDIIHTRLHYTRLYYIRLYTETGGRSKNWLKTKTALRYLSVRCYDVKQILNLEVDVRYLINDTKTK